MFICADTEDDSAELLAAGKSGFGKRVTQIAALSADGPDYYSKGDVKGFKKWLLRRPERHIYFHNVQYDLGNLFSKELDDLDVTLVGGRIIKAVWGQKQFLDSFNLWPMTAKKLGEAFGLNKMEMDIHSRAYVFRDVEIIVAAIRFVWDFCHSIGVQTPPPTLGGLSVKFWKYVGGENCHDSSELSRLALFGGKVELFKVESETESVAWTDINSLYPAVMRGGFPAELEETGSNPKEHGIAKVIIRVPESELCILPYRNRERRILYPWGRFQGTWTMAEIGAAVERGAKIEKVIESMTTAETCSPYAEFVERLYRARMASNSDAENLFFKLLMNNLYGRLGTSGVIGRTVWQTEDNKYDGIPFGEKVLTKYAMPLSEETNWSHAAHVTAYGRLALMEYMEKVGAARMIYADTDSAIFDSSVSSVPFVTSGELGEMKLIQRCSVCGDVWHPKKPCPGGVAEDRWPACHTYAPKLYSVGNSHKAKGVPQRLAKTFIETGHAEFDLPYKYREAVRFYDRKNARRLSVWRQVQKFRRGEYDRKELRGNRFFPCKVNEIVGD